MADGRARAGVVLFVDGRLAVREVWEETGLRVELTSQPSLRLDTPRGGQWVFHAIAVGGTFGAGDGVEFAGSRGGRGTYQPILLARTELAAMNLVPLPVAEVVLRAWSTGVWWDETLVLDDAPEYAPERVRGTAIVIRDNAILLIEREREGQRWYEIPGGGAEGNEKPDAAAVRELQEETGLSGTVVREVATVFRLGHRLHCDVVEAEGPIGARAVLDLEPDARPVWCPLADLASMSIWPTRLGWRIADWHANDWPDVRVRLCDSIVDLDAPCDW